MAERAHIIDRQVPPYFPRFMDLFAVVNRDFETAAVNWSIPRLNASVLPDSEKEKIAGMLIEDVLVRFHGEAIKTDVFPKIEKILDNSSHYMLWSSGIPRVQMAKAAAVRALFSEQTQAKELPEIAEENKFSNLEAVGNRLFQIGIQRKGQLPHVLVIEDKITSIFQWMAQFDDLPDIMKSILKNEEALIKLPDNEFDKLLREVESYVDKHPEYFDSFSFLYVPPDKPKGKDPITQISPERDPKIRRILDAANTAYKGSRKPFCHISEPLEDLPPDYVALVNVDGVLVSQQKVLDSREEELSSTFIKETKLAYKQTYGLTPSEFIRFLFDDKRKNHLVEDPISKRLLKIISKSQIMLDDKIAYDISINDRSRLDSSPITIRIPDPKQYENDMIELGLIDELPEDEEPTETQ